MKVLIVEDNTVFGRNLKKGVEEAGWTVDLAVDGEEGLFLAENGHYDVIALDWMLPKVSGLDLLKAMRKKSIDAPTIMITARGAVQDRVEGLEQGADDYIVKPFELAELVARLNALFRRSIGKSSSKISVGLLVLDLAKQNFSLNDVPLDLTGKEFDLLVALVSKADQMVRRSALVAMLYPMNDEPESNSIDVLIARIRKKMTGSAVEIITIRGKGFILRVAENPS